MPYTDLQIKNLPILDKRQKKSVGNSLFVVVESKKKAKNTKSFVGQMRWKNKQISVRIGVYGTGYNQWSLKDARDEWNRLKTWSKEEGRDPRDLQKEEKSNKSILYPTRFCQIQQENPTRFFGKVR